MTQLQAGTVTFLFTDIEGSTALLRRHGRERYGELLERHQVLLRNAFEAHRGEEIETQGDSFFVAFASASDAVAAAAELQRSLTEDGEMRVRVGIHSGEASSAGGRYVGFSVHRAARIGAVGHGGQVLLSETTRTLVADDLPDGFSLRDLGEFRLKDMQRPERITQLVVDGLPTEFPVLRGAERVDAPSRRVLRRRSVLASALVGVLAAAVAIPVFALGQGSSVARAASLVRVDPAKVKVTDGIDVPGHPVAVTTCAASVFVSSRDGYVYEIDPSTGRPAGIFVGARPGDIAHIGGLATVLRGTSAKNSVTVIDAGSGTPSTPFALPGSPVSSARITVLAADVYVANPNARKLERIGSPYTGVARQAIALPRLKSARRGYSGLAADADHGALWIAGNNVDRTVWRVDLATRRVTPIALGFAPRAIAYGSGGVWLVDQADNFVYRIDPKTNKLGTRIGVGEEPSAVTTGGGYVWVANALDGTVSRINPLDGSVRSAKIGGRPIAIAVGLGAVWVLRKTG
jgi:class 3 adenylate cyclase/DNA-binding beta-propeller fold protein YncE